GLCVLLILGFGAALARSPLLSPGSYQVPPGAVQESSPRRHNVLWIVLDTVRADHMSCYGYERHTTPFLEDWARQAIVFDHAVADGIWTLPSHASMFTGLSTREHGVHANHTWLDDGITTVADVLTANGFTTASFSNNHLIARHTNLAKGFEECCVMGHARRMSRFSLEHLCESWGITPMFPWLDGDFGAALTNHVISNWLDERTDEKRPFFLFVNYMDAHLPYRVPKRYRRMFMTEPQVHRSYDLRQSVFGNLLVSLTKRFNIEGGEFITEPDREVVKKQYSAAIRYLDDRV
ncbi:MAG: sulfatase-like hydrolase/transferase, partial [Deltaproteobacteria bacterium]|nr:sulfatase-like hydrolase/transferase [Deltaproteobacteria bacterium]